VALVITEAQEVPEVKFPWQQIATTFRNGNHDLDYNEHTLTRWCDTPITGANEVIGSLYLSLLYNDSLSNQKRSTYILHRTGHFQIGNLNNHGIIEEDIPKIQSYANKLILSFALDEAEANIFNNTPYNQWINALTPEFIKLHYLPSDKNLYTLANLPKWVEERKKLIAERLKNLFNEL
jgi:hypothetical protein